MDNLILDLRYAVRSLARRPALVLGAVLTLGLGIGANTSFFSAIDAVLLRPPAGLASPDRLVAVYTSDFSGPPYGTSSYPDYYDLRARSEVFDGIASWYPFAVALGEDPIEATATLAVSANYLDVLGVRPAAGRVFLPQEEENPADVLVLAEGLAIRHFGTAAAAVGRSIQVNGRMLEVVGVTPAGFTGFSRSAPAEVFVPTRAAFRLGLGADVLEDRGSRGIGIVARLASGVTLEEARGAMELAAARQFSAYPDAWTDVRGEPRRLSVLSETVVRVSPGRRGAILGLAGVLMAAVGLVLLICCANVAGLLIARTAGRAREIGIRVSLGASGPGIVRQLLVESMVLALAGGALGTLLSFWLTDLIARGIGRDSPFGLNVEAGVNLRVLGFTAIVSVLTGLLFGLAPALRARRTDVMSALRQERNTLGGGARTPLRSVLVAAQLALSLPLLAGALLLARSLTNAYRIDPGFALADALLVGVAPLPGTAVADPAITTLAIRDRIAALPGVSAVSWGSATPLSGFGSRRGMQVIGYTPQQGEDMEFHVNHVGPDYFAAAGISIERGRSIVETDREGSPDVVVVNETFAARFWPGQDPIGQSIAMGRNDTLPRVWTVVGVASDVNYLSLTEPVRPYVWTPALQMPGGVRFHLRTASDPMTLDAAIRQIVGEVAPGWSPGSVLTMESRLASSLFAERVTGASMGLFALFALLLGAVGLWGVIAFAVTQRTREVGIRVALGAAPRGVLGLFLRQALPVLGTGIVIGIALALAATRALRSLLIGVDTMDVPTLAASVLVLVVTTMVATWLPARRATRVDPMIALRAE